MPTFGPVPSRRLGRSLGINTIPPKTCTYSCIYCQLGRTTRMLAEPRALSDPAAILCEVEGKLASARGRGERVDILTFVPDGEPTLDTGLGREIESLRPLGVRIGVITNASLLWRREVREALEKADWVSLKVDAADDATWRRMNRPHRSLRFGAVVEGLLEFSRGFRGELATETMLVRGVNDTEQQVSDVAGVLSRVRPAAAYLAVPTRPPAEPWVVPPDERTVLGAYELLRQGVGDVELLTGSEGNEFACTGDAQADLLGITSVHPMRKEAVAEFLAKAGADWSAVRTLLDQQALVEVPYRGDTFYVRRFTTGKRHGAG